MPAREPLPVRSLGLLLILLLAAAAPMPTPAALDDLNNWTVKRGDWTAVDGRFRGTKAGLLEYNDPVPTDGVLSFTFSVTGNRRPYIVLGGTGAYITGPPGSGKLSLGIYGKVHDTQGEPIAFKNKEPVQCGIRVGSDGHVELTMNGQSYSAAATPAEHYRLEIRPGPRATPDPVDFYGFSFTAGPAGDPRTVPRPDPPPDADGTTASRDVGAIDVPVTCRRPSSQPADVPAAQADPSAIERPAFADTPKPLVRPITSVTGMAVTVGEDGEESGETLDIIATVRPASRHGNKAGVAFVMRGDGDLMMKTALQEAVRAVQVRYPIWAPGYIDLSFGDKFDPHAGPSAGTAFALLVLSTLEDVPLDPQCAVTGDLTVDWKVRKVGGVAAKLRGATLDGCTAAVIPDTNEQAFADMGLLYGHSAWWKLQVFACGTVQQAMAVARADRSPRLTEAMAAFAALAAKLDKAEAATLRDPQTKATLQHVLGLAPNHLSARNVLALCDGTAPKFLSIGATEYKLSIILYPYYALVKDGRPLDRTAVTTELLAKTRRRIAALRPVADRTLLPLIASVQSYSQVLNEFARGEATADSVRARAAIVGDRLDELESDPNFTERSVREGY